MKMTQRDKNRKREHEPHGWGKERALVEGEVGEVFARCPCGWFGWVSEACFES